MEIRNLMTFAQVAELSNFTKAAQILGYSQSTVSFQIKQLEAELDCLLFERINHTVTLTDRGRELLRYAQDVLRLTEEFKQNSTDTNQLKGFIHVVTPDSVCEDMLVKNYHSFHKCYPDINLKFTNADTGDMFDMLDHNEADVIMTLDNHVYRSDYVIAKEEHVSMSFVTSSSSSFASKKAVSISEIADRPFILTEKGMGYRRILDKELAKCSIELDPVLEVGRPDIIIKLLEENDAISFLPDFATRKKVEQGKLMYLDVCDVQVDIWKQLIYHRNKWISNCLRAFLEFVKTAEFAS